MPTRFSSLRLRAPPRKNLEKFQNNSEQRVLLLNVMDESTSGTNLTSANHGILLLPMLTPTQEIYQAIGRLRRYDQTKMAYIWRFLTKDTVGSISTKRELESIYTTISYRTHYFYFVCCRGSAFFRHNHPTTFYQSDTSGGYFIKLYTDPKSPIIKRCC